jgi:hypothetical protein
VIKTVNEQGAKVFINMCGTTKLAMPPGWSKGQVPAEVRRRLPSAAGTMVPSALLCAMQLGC